MTIWIYLNQFPVTEDSNRATSGKSTLHRGLTCRCCGSGKLTIFLGNRSCILNRHLRLLYQIHCFQCEQVQCPQGTLPYRPCLATTVPSAHPPYRPRLAGGSEIATSAYKPTRSSYAVLLNNFYIRPPLPLLLINCFTATHCSDSNERTKHGHAEQRTYHRRDKRSRT